MKKMLLAVVITLMLFVSGCDGEEKGNALENALETMDSAESIRMDLTMYDLPLFGTLSLVMKVDGSLMYVSNPLGDPTYSKQVEGLEYEYVLNDQNVLVLSETPLEEQEDFSSSSFTEDLDAKNFAEEEGVWVYSGDNIYLDDEETEYMTDIEITLDKDGNFELMTFVIYTDDLSTNVDLTISGINDTTIVVPVNYDE